MNLSLDRRIGMHTQGRREFLVFIFGIFFCIKEYSFMTQILCSIDSEIYISLMF